MRIDGSIRAFGDPCVDRIRHSTKQRAVTADVVIVEDAVTYSLPDTRSHLAEWVGLAITKCIERLQKKKFLQDVNGLTMVVDNALKEFSRTTP